MAARGERPRRGKPRAARPRSHPPVLQGVLGARQNNLEAAASRRLDKNAGWFRYVNVIYIHNGVIAVMEREMAYTADVNRWRGPTEENYRPHMLESPWHPGWIAVTILGFIIWWPIGLALLFFTLGSSKKGCWSNGDRWQNKRTSRRRAGEQRRAARAPI